LGILTSFKGVYFGHALSKACQYAISNEKVNSSIQPMNIKCAKSSIQDYILHGQKNQENEM
jgi:hypothetical protein